MFWVVHPSFCQCTYTHSMTLFRNKYKSKLVIYLFRLSVIIFMIQAMLLSRPQNREDNAALTRLIHRPIFPLDLEVENFLFYFFHIKSNPKKILLLVHFTYNWENRKQSVADYWILNGESIVC